MTPHYMHIRKTDKGIFLVVVQLHRVSRVSKISDFKKIYRDSDDIGDLVIDLDFQTTKEEDTEKNVSLLLDGEEYEISFIDPPTMPDTPADDTLESCDAFIVVFSLTDRDSFGRSVDALFRLREKGCTANKAVILVGNKSDLVRSRDISEDEAKSIACSYECKFIETSAAINHQVDELLVGIVTQIRLKAQQQVERKAFEGQGLQKKGSFSRMERRASSIINRLLGKGKLKSQSCGNLHVL